MAVELGLRGLKSDLGMKVPSTRFQGLEQPGLRALRPDFPKPNSHNPEARRHIAALSLLQAKARIRFDDLANSNIEALSYLHTIWGFVL